MYRIIHRIIQAFKPKIIYRDDINNIYLKRYYIIPNNKYFNVYIHKFYSSDFDKHLHDHPWWNISILLTGSYLEHVPKDYNKWIKNESREEIVLKRYPFIPIWRSAYYIHKIELVNNEPIWTLFITGPVIRNWGFFCPTSWRANEEYLNENTVGNISSIGKGCD